MSTCNLQAELCQTPSASLELVPPIPKKADSVPAESVSHIPELSAPFDLSLALPVASIKNAAFGDCPPRPIFGIFKFPEELMLDKTAEELSCHSCKLAVCPEAALATTGTFPELLVVNVAVPFVPLISVPLLLISMLPLKIAPDLL